MLIIETRFSEKIDYSIIIYCSQHTDVLSIQILLQFLILILIS